MKRVSLLLAALVLAGCGSNKTSSYTTTPPTTDGTTTRAAGAETTSFLVYLVDPGDGKLYADERTVPKTEAVAAAALKSLASSPNSSVPGGLTATIDNGDATVSGA